MVFPLRKKETEGFTLIELLVVISIISLLSSIVLASLGTARERARLASAQSGLQSLATELSLLAFDEAGGYIVGNDGGCDEIVATSSFGTGDDAQAVAIVNRIGSDLGIDLGDENDCYLDFGWGDNLNFMVFNMTDLSSGNYGCIKEGVAQVISAGSMAAAETDCQNNY